ncbi:hypothetical protein ON010_g16454 [Phytophthora cinnamomi]|nr:hypothetical protein ON010_g16454 [Phytophthora cinnamomi]
MSLAARSRQLALLKKTRTHAALVSTREDHRAHRSAETLGLPAEPAAAISPPTASAGRLRQDGARVRGLSTGTGRPAAAAASSGPGTAGHHGRATVQQPSAATATTVPIPIPARKPGECQDREPAQLHPVGRCARAVFNNVLCLVHDPTYQHRLPQAQRPRAPETSPPGPLHRHGGHDASRSRRGEDAPHCTARSSGSAASEPHLQVRRLHPLRRGPRSLRQARVVPSTSVAAGDMAARWSARPRAARTAPSREATAGRTAAAPSARRQTAIRSPFPTACAGLMEEQCKLRLRAAFVWLERAGSKASENASRDKTKRSEDAGSARSTMKDSVCQIIDSCDGRASFSVAVVVDHRAVSPFWWSSDTTTDAVLPPVVDASKLPWGREKLLRFSADVAASPAVMTNRMATAVLDAPADVS